jgi:hypothetical protein
MVKVFPSRSSNISLVQACPRTHFFLGFFALSSFSSQDAQKSVRIKKIPDAFFWLWNSPKTPLKARIPEGA